MSLATALGSNSYTDVANGTAGESLAFTLWARDAVGNLCECGGALNPIGVSISLSDGA